MIDIFVAKAKLLAGRIRTMNDNVLQHHGILGQKWGVRRYQNPDGTLTMEGKLRYQKTKLKAGTVVKRVGYRDDPLKRDKYVYLDENEQDHNFYTRQDTLNALKWTHSGKKAVEDAMYEHSYVLSKDIKIAPIQKAVKEMYSLGEKDDKMQRIGIQSTLKSKRLADMEEKSWKKWEPSIGDKIEKARLEEKPAYSYLTKKDYNKMWELVDREMREDWLMNGAGDAYSMSKIKSALQKKGYGGYTDVDIYDGETVQPLVIFYTEGILQKNGSVPISKLRKDDTLE